MSVSRRLGREIEDAAALYTRWPQTVLMVVFVVKPMLTIVLCSEMFCWQPKLCG
jgi:hypothetical protein